MYINDIHILYYLLFGILGLIVGQFVDWCNRRLPEYKKIFTKEIWKEYQLGFKPNYLLMAITAIIYLALLYRFGIQDTITANMKLLKYLTLTPMLLSALVIDYRMQIIPNRLNLTIFEVGLLFVFIDGVTNFSLAINELLGMIAGGGIFLIITLIGGIIAGKEAMGFGDVKLMGAIGLYFGWVNVILLSVLSFFIGAILSVILLITKKKKSNEYIPFGPFIVISTFGVILIPTNILIYVLLKVFTLGLYKGKLT